MLEIVDHRHADWRQILTEKVMEQLAWLSGGNVRRFFNLLRIVARKAALSRSTLPIDDPDAQPVSQALGEAARPRQWLTGPDRLWLKRFMEDSRNPAGHIQDLAADLPSIIRLFDLSLDLDYQNGDVWYQVPPLVTRQV